MEKKTATRTTRTAVMIAAAMLLAILGVAWTMRTGDAGSVTANPLLPTATFTIGSPPMTTLLDLEVARTPEEQERGLMARDAVGSQGMAFPWTGRRAGFWMHGTRIPLDIVYVGPDGRVESVHRGEPFDAATLPSRGAVSLVIEVPAGRARLYGLKPGAIVRSPPGILR